MILVRKNLSTTDLLDNRVCPSTPFVTPSVRDLCISIEMTQRLNCVCVYYYIVLSMNN